jgi:hypothetical protein
MKWYKEVYGDDLDGNRGILIWVYELEPIDKDWIQAEIVESLLEFEQVLDYDDYVDIPTINPYTEDDETITVKISDWLPMERFLEIMNEAV